MGSVSFEAVGIIVRDMGAALAFYRHLGLETPPQADAQGHAEVALPGGQRYASVLAPDGNVVDLFAQR